MRNVRIDSITIKNFKNVKNGSIALNSKLNNKASILGLYGQNGSGKTALIDAIGILKMVLSGRRIHPSIAELINVDSSYSSFEYVFSMRDNEDVISLFYNFSLRKEEKTEVVDSEKKYYTAIFDEQISISRSSNDKVILTKQDFINAIGNNTFGPNVKYLGLFGDSNEIETDIIVAKKYAYKSGTSFVFSKEFLKLLFNKHLSSDNYLNNILLETMQTIVNFAEKNLFVLSKKDSAIVNFDALQLFFRIDNKQSGSAGSIIIPIDSIGIIPEDAYGIVNKVIEIMDIVLPQLVPGLKINIKTVGEDVNSEGNKIYKVQLFSSKNSVDIPLKYESEGIKKIVVMLQLLIVIYNNPSVTVAIDELDSGIFEYLLGELVKIISENGKGQLIFTSHNLRPLETINKNYVAFTTINPNNRYIRFVHLKPTNNLRDYYYRDIILGEDQEEITYEKTNNRKIAFAFEEAGELND